MALPSVFPARRGTDLARLGGAAVVASFPTYAHAARAVAALGEARFPVRRTAIVGADLRLLEGVPRPRRPTLFAAGSWLAVLATVLVSTAGGPAAVLTALTLGCLSGAALAGGTRPRISAGRYDVYVDAEVCAAAYRLLLCLQPAGMSHAGPAHLVPIAA